MSEPFKVPTHMLPSSMKQTPPNMFFSENPFRRERALRTRATSASSFAISLNLFALFDFAERSHKVRQVVHLEGAVNRAS